MIYLQMVAIFQKLTIKNDGTDAMTAAATLTYIQKIRSKENIFFTTDFFISKISKSISLN